MAACQGYIYRRGKEETCRWVTVVGTRGPEEGVIVGPPHVHVKVL